MEPAAAAAPQQQGAAGEAALLVNLRSSRARQQFPRLQQLLRAQGWQLSAVHASGEAHALPGALQQLLDAGHRRILVGGGDGTISACLGALVARRAVLGILPLGTANSFARALGLPLSLDAAVEALSAGHVERVDLGRIGDTYFANTVAIGVAPAVAHAMPRKLKRALGVLSYPYVGAKIFARHRAFRAHVRWSEGEVDGPVLDILIANGPYLGAAPLAPQAHPQDRRLFVRVVRGRSPWSLLRVWWPALRGAPICLPYADEFETERVRIDTQPPQRVSVDGELCAMTPVDVSIATRALAVIVPPAR